jgi:hypothetical protein
LELAQFSTSLDADPTCLRGLRRRIAKWLADAGIEGETKDAVVLAAHEATASAIGSSSESVSVEGRVSAHSVVMVVASDGEWPSVARDEAGHRMEILRSVLTSVRFEPGPDHGSVRLEKRF